MNIYLMIAIIIANAIAIGIVYQFVKKMENRKKIIIIAMSVAIMYILISITYWLSGFGFDKNIHEESKNFIIYLFVPINMILFIPYSMSQYAKVKAKTMKVQNFSKKLVMVILLLIIVLVLEYFYFRDIQSNINAIGSKVEQSNTTLGEEVQDQNAITNEIANETNNENEISNIVEENVI